MKKEIKWSIAAVLLLCMGVVVYFLFLRPAPVSHTTSVSYTHLTLPTTILV